ncbi:MAG: alkaline phosphatase family protein, partial [Armatimonadetes bacterium]|nr:alkaline phosphatase family protein [Armatimonadota bacterium]
MRRCARPLAWWLAISAALAAGWGTSAAPAPRARAAIFFAADGMRQDLVERYAAEGATPAFRRLLEEGARAEGAGALPAFPPNTGVGWPTLATGAWPAVHGAVNNTFHEVGGDFARSQRAFAPGVLQAETLAEAAERAGRRVVVFEWPTGRYYPIKGPAVDYRTFFSRRGILTTFDPPGLSLPLVREFGLVAARAAFRDASGWTDAPQSHSPAREAILVIPTTNEAVNPARVYWLYVFDSTNDGRVNYDHVLVAETKSARAPVAILRPGYFVEVKVKLAGGRAGQAAGFYLR